MEMRRAEDGMRFWLAEPGEYHMSYSGELGGLWRRKGAPPQSTVRPLLSPFFLVFTLVPSLSWQTIVFLRLKRFSQQRIISSRLKEMTRVCYAAGGCRVYLAGFRRLR